jgi:hypothetical protein
MNELLKQSSGIESTVSRPGMLNMTMVLLFRTESLMLSFAGPLRITEGQLQAEYHYDPQVGIILRGVVSPPDVSRILSAAAEFPGITYARAELETVLPTP